MSIATLIDAVIVLTAVEGLALALHRRLTGRGLPAAEYALNLASGLALMLALRAAIAGAHWGAVAAALAAAGLLHALDIVRRWRRA